jgi:hypothetical protein
MEKRAGFENALKDIKMEFEFLKEYGFQLSGESDLPYKASVGYRGIFFNILLNYEFMEQNFDFCLINKNDPSQHTQFWKILDELNPNFKYERIKPTLDEYKEPLHQLALEFKKICQTLFK